MSQPTGNETESSKGYRQTGRAEQGKRIRRVLTLLLGKGDQVYYYEGTLLPDASNFKTSNFKEIRNEILSKKKSTDPKDFVVVIKADKDCTYKNVVDILDEMLINDVKRYATVDISDVEYQLIQATEGSAGKISNLYLWNFI